MGSDGHLTLIPAPEIQDQPENRMTFRRGKSHDSWPRHIFKRPGHVDPLGWSIKGSGVKNKTPPPLLSQGSPCPSESTQRDADNLSSLWKHQRKIKDIIFNLILITECPTDRDKRGTNTLVPI